DEKNQILKSNVWLRMMWYDYQLEWDPAEYGGITVIRIQPDRVWKPDIVLFNNADGKYEVSFKPNLVIYDSGKVLWIPPAIYKSSCTINVEYFPFDEQQCEMNFGSWTFNDLQVVLGWYEGQQKVDLEDYSPSGSWDLIACPGQLTSQDKDGQHNISMITYKLTIRRKTLYYTVNLILPCVLITFLSFCVFFLPADAHEKMTMCISILLALVVFLVLVSKILPPTSVTTPLIAKYLLFTFIMNFCTIIITVVIINWNFRTPRTHRMHRWIRSLFLNYLPRVVMMKRPNHEKRTEKKLYAHRHDSRQMREADYKNDVRCCPGRSDDDLEEEPFNEDVVGGGGGRKNQQMGCKGPSGGSSNVGPASSPDAIKAIEAIKLVAAHLKNEDDYNEILDDWRYVASVIDRLQLYVFVAITIGGTLGILINAPHIFETVDQEKVRGLDRMNE
ncbi:hypothetical protein HELRODRAFT_80095, partial [Helobdella robusta]|uniref:Uncharacterized protein n=1 Tax=Helobdella robusta TaxID=6412 RepID=T1G3X7_HELRO